MKTGDIVLLPFPFAELTNTKVRPTVVVCETRDTYKDLVVCAIRSVVPTNLSSNEILLQADNINQLRVISVVKIDRIFTTKQQNVVVRLGELNPTDLSIFKEKFKSLVE